MSKELSGAQRRKLIKGGEAAHDELLSKVPKLKSFFAPSTLASENQLESTVIITEALKLNQDDINNLVADQVLELSVQTDYDALENESPSQSLILKDNIDQSSLLTSNLYTWPEDIKKEQSDDLILKGPAPFSKSDYE